MPSYGTASSCSPSKRVRHRCKRHRANIWRRPGAKHCSSLCSQSGEANIVADKHELKIQRRYAPERWLYSLRVRGPHFASKVSYNAGASDLRRMFAQRLLLLCRTCYANLQMMVGLALEVLRDLVWINTPNPAINGMRIVPLSSLWRELKTY